MRRTSVSYTHLHVLRRGSQDGHAHLHQGLGQLNGGLSAKLYHSSIRLLQTHDALHILRGQRFEIQLIRNIEVGTYRLRVIVDDEDVYKRQQRSIPPRLW